MEKMIKVKRLNVKVTYYVGLGDVEIPEEVYDQMVKARDNSDEIDASNLKYPDAAEWLIANISERDCYEHNTEIEEIK